MSRLRRKAGIPASRQVAGRRHDFKLILWVGLVLLIAVPGVLIHLPLLILEPGPAPDVARRTSIQAPTFPSRGSIHLTTVKIAEPSGSTVKELLQAIFNANREVIPREAVVPQGQSDVEAQTVQAAQMTQSEQAATLAALSALGMPYQPDGAFVLEISDKSAAGQLEPGDVITAAAGAPVSRLGDLQLGLKGLMPGEQVTLTVKRGARDRIVKVRTIRSSKGKTSASLPARLEQNVRPPVQINIDAREIGGPSAGLMFALSIYDRLSPGDLTRGKRIAGTGTIENTPRQTGLVGAVGAVQLKIEGARKIGAQVFLAPKKEAAEARRAAAGSMTVLGVSTLEEAVRKLNNLR